MKNGIRILGVDDGPFSKTGSRRVLVVGAVYRGNLFDGLLSTKIVRDGYNSTFKLEKMILESKFLKQLHAVMLDGIALGGFNIVDIKRLNYTIDIPVIVVSRKKPDLGSVHKALERLPRTRYRQETVKRAGRVYRAGRVWCQVAGADSSWACEIVQKSATRSHVPEPLRAAHLIAGGLVTGQSGRRA